MNAFITRDESHGYRAAWIFHATRPRRSPLRVVWKLRSRPITSRTPSKATDLTATSRCVREGDLAGEARGVAGLGGGLEGVKEAIVDEPREGLRGDVGIERLVEGAERGEQCGERFADDAVVDARDEVACGHPVRRIARCVGRVAAPRLRRPTVAQFPRALSADDLEERRVLARSRVTDHSHVLVIGGAGRDGRAGIRRP